MEKLTTKDVELVIVNDEEIIDLNKEHRGKESATDVLSFPIEMDFPHAPLGSIIISIDTAKKQATSENLTLDEELKILFLHGLLHLLGFDHETDNGEMAEKEEFLRTELNLKTTLIKRNS